MSTNELSARAKLLNPPGSAPILPFEDLPADRSDPDWLRVEEKYGLGFGELLALKNARCIPALAGGQPQGGTGSFVDNTHVLQKLEALSLEVKKSNEEMKKSNEEMKGDLKKVTFQLDTLQDEKLSLYHGQGRVSGSNTDHGTLIFNNLNDSSNVSRLKDGEGLTAIPIDVIMKGRELLKEVMEEKKHEKKPHEKLLVNLYTPYLMEIIYEIDPNLRLVNSERYKWIHVASGHVKSDLEPDLFSSHHSLVQYREAYKNAPECEVHRLFGKFHAWDCRSSIHCVYDAKWTIDKAAFGEKCKYLEICGDQWFDYNGVAVKLRGVLFDVEEFWMIRSSGSTIVDVVQCRWDMFGSRKILTDFLSVKDPWMTALSAFCQKLSVSVCDFSMTTDSKCAWLGAGANGRVFKLNCGKVVKLVVGRRSDNVEKEYKLMLNYFKQSGVSSSIFPIEEDSYRDGTLESGVKYAGYLLAVEGDKLLPPLPKSMIEPLARSLCNLHTHGVIQGDPRLDNVLVLNGQLKWIDFRESEMVTTTVGLRRDMTILCQSLGASIMEVSDDIEVYIGHPTIDKLREILEKVLNAKA